MKFKTAALAVPLLAAASAAQAALAESILSAIATAQADLLGLYAALLAAGAVLWVARHIKSVFAFPKRTP